MDRKGKPENVVDRLISFGADEFHRLDRSLFQKNEFGGSRVIQFTSSRRKEGVTSIVLGFAGFMSRLHGPEDLIVIEANVREPAVAGLLGLSSQKTLLGLLRKKMSQEEVIQLSPDYGYSVIIGDDPQDNSEGSIEMLLERLGDVVPELRKKYRYILIDSPPAISYIDANIVAGYTDGVVMVVQSNSTRSEVLDDAAEKLRNGGADILGVILNKRIYHIPKWLYRFL
jgi:Mrp family chromosome partitioning ATPase